MKDEVLFNPTGQLTIEDVLSWMDGGSVTLFTRDKALNHFEIEFVQKVSLVKRDNLPYPGSLLLNKREVEIRSELESKIIATIKSADWGQKIDRKERPLLEQMVKECVDFTTSDKFIEVARKVGRLN
ncbi:MAG: hypothetical protein HYZ44_04730 [Bacteroidetes bacterium]|nr:hypothetical protein [Bacteroidota bacterium]